MDFWTYVPWPDETKFEPIGRNDHCYVYLKENGGSVQAREHHPNCKVQRRHHFVMFLQERPLHLTKWMSSCQKQKKNRSKC